MKSSLGFVLVTHTNPDQIYRLINTLNRMFEHPPMACHHDFSKCMLQTDALPANVKFVQPHRVTGWANFTFVEAMIAALQLLYSGETGPDWFLLLSGADYPIKPAGQILEDLANAQADAYIHHRLIDVDEASHRWDRLCVKRYLTAPLLPATFRQWPRLYFKLRLSPRLSRHFLPFSNEFRCYAGSGWFYGNRHVAAEIVQSLRQKKLVSHYRRTLAPDESFFHTILANAPHLRLDNHACRFADWSAGGPHPKILTTDDLPNIIASRAYFARKFDLAVDSAVLDELDRLTR